MWQEHYRSISLSIWIIAPSSRPPMMILSREAWIFISLVCTTMWDEFAKFSQTGYRRQAKSHYKECRKIRRCPRHTETAFFHELVGFNQATTAAQRIVTFNRSESFGNIALSQRCIETPLNTCRVGTILQFASSSHAMGFGKMRSG